MPLRIVTWNFLAGGSSRRTAHWQLIRDRLAPEILMTQECKPDLAGQGWSDQLWARAAGPGWGTGLYVARGRISRIPIPGFSGWVTGGELDGCRVTRRPLRAFSVHCPPGQHGYVSNMGRILDRLAPLSRDADLVVGGDFNVVAGLRGPDEPVRMSGAERLLLRRFSDELGLIPCWQTMNPGAPLAQTLRWTGNRAMPYHCDGIFVPARWRGRLGSCEVLCGSDWERLSDHNPVVAVVSLQPAGTRGAAASPRA